MCLCACVKSPGALSMPRLPCPSHGQGTKVDYELALHWFDKAAEHGLHGDAASHAWAQQAANAAQQLRPLIKSAEVQASAALEAAQTSGQVPINKQDTHPIQPIPLARTEQQSEAAFQKLQAAVRLAEARAAAKNMQRQQRKPEPAA